MKCFIFIVSGPFIADAMTLFHCWMTSGCLWSFISTSFKLWWLIDSLTIKPYLLISISLQLKTVCCFVIRLVVNRYVLCSFTSLIYSYIPIATTRVLHIFSTCLVAHWIIYFTLICLPCIIIRQTVTTVILQPDENTVKTPRTFKTLQFSSKKTGPMSYVPSLKRWVSNAFTLRTLLCRLHYLNRATVMSFCRQNAHISYRMVSLMG